MEEKDIFLETRGLGFIIYSDFAVKKRVVSETH